MKLIIATIFALTVCGSALLRVSVTRWFVALMLLVPVCASATDYYKCHRLDGSAEFSDAPCAEGAKKVTVDATSPYERDQKTGMDRARKEGFEEQEYYTFCSLSSGEINIHCMKRQADSRREMLAKMADKSTTPEQQVVIKSCFLKWYKPTMKVVDGEMWGYCYSHY